MGGLQPKKGITFEVKVVAYLLTSEYDFDSFKLDLREPIEFDIYLNPYPREYTSFDIEVDLDIYFKSKRSTQFLFECKAGDRSTIGPKSGGFIDALSKFYALKKYRDAEEKRGFPVQFVFATNMNPRKIISFIQNPTKDLIKTIKLKLTRELQKKGAILKTNSINVEELSNFIRSIFVIYLSEKKFDSVEDNFKFAENIKKVLDKVKSKKKSPIHGVSPYVSIEDAFDIYVGRIKNLREKDLENIKVEQIMDVYIGFDVSLEDTIDLIRRQIEQNIACRELSLKEFNLSVQLINKTLNALDVYGPLTKLVNSLLPDYRVFIYSDLENFLLYNPKIIAKIVSESRFFERNGFDLNKIKNKAGIKISADVLIEVAIDSYAVEKGHRLSPRKFILELD